MALQPEKPIKRYASTQLELYEVCKLGVKSFEENVGDFSEWKGYYDPAWAAQFRLEITAAEDLPDFQQRDEPSETTRINMVAKAEECLKAWQRLKRHIADAFPEEVQKPKLEAAGSTLYEDAASENWEKLKGLMTNGNKFIADNLATLTANNNMPPVFQGDFTTLKDEFEALFEQFGDAREDAEEQTTEKIDANNALHAITMKMAEDGQKIYRDDRATQERFIYEKVLGMVRGSRGVDRTFEIDPASRLVIERVVSNSAIENTGTTTVWITEGDVEIQPPGALQLDPGEEIIRPEDNSSVTIFNNDPAASGEVQARVTID